MSSGPHLDDLLDGPVSGSERARLATVHERLLEAGPPPELPPGLVEPPAPPAAPVVRLPQRYRYTAVAAAAVLAVTLFGAGYLVAGGDGPETPVQTLALSGSAGADGSLAVFEKDAAGNWPMELTVTGLPQLPAGKTYELWLTRDGERVESCGSFVVQGAETVVRLNAPYRLDDFSGWVVTAGVGPGDVVLRTATV